MDHFNSGRQSLAAVLAAIALGGAMAGAIAAPPADPLQQAIARGRETFLNNTFGGRRVCNNCHLGGGTKPGQTPDGQAIPSLSNAASIFPRVDEDSHVLITLPDQVRQCVAGAIHGKAPEYGSDELNALVAYLTSLSQGKAIQMGGEPR